MGIMQIVKPVSNNAVDIQVLYEYLIPCIHIYCSLYLCSDKTLAFKYYVFQRKTVFKCS